MGDPLPIGRREQRAYLGLYIYTAMLAFSTLWWPWGPDQGSFALGGEIVANGGLPFRDVWEMKGPGCHLTYAAGHLLFGRNQWGIRVIDLTFLFLTAACLWQFLHRQCGTRAAHAGVLFFCFSHLELGFWHTAQPDGWAGMLLLLAFLLLAGPKQTGYARFFGAGLLVGAATQYKFLYAAFLLPMAFLDRLSAHRPPGRDALRWAALIAGFAAVNGLVLGWLAANQALAEYMDITFSFNRVVHMARHKSHLPFLHLNLDVLDFSRRYLLRYILVLPLAIFGILAYRKQWPALTRAMGLFWLTGLGVVIIQGTYHAWYHWMPTYGAKAIFFGFGLTALAQRPSKTPAQNFGRRKLVAAVGPVILLLTAIPSHRDFVHTARFAAGVISSEQYRQKFDATGSRSFSLVAEEKVSQYLRRRSGETDRLLVWGFDPGIYYLAGREPATRFIFHYPLITTKGSRYHDRYRKELLAEVRKNRPLYVLIEAIDETGAPVSGHPAKVDDFQALSAHINRLYAMEARIDRFELWRRKDSPA